MVYGRQSHIHVRGWYWLQCFINLPKGKFNSTINNISFQIIIYHSLSSRSSGKEEEADENELDWAKSCLFAHKINRFEYTSNDLKFYFIEYWTIVFIHNLIELFALISLMPANAANAANEEVLVNAYCRTDHTNVNWFRACTKSVNYWIIARSVPHSVDAQQLLGYAFFRLTCGCSRFTGLCSLCFVLEKWYRFIPWNSCTLESWTHQHQKN